MLYKSLILGVLFSVGIFAVKSGVGLSHGVARQARWPAKAVVFLIFATGYGLFFGLVAMTLGRLDPVRHLAAIQRFLQSGMGVHVVMAVAMMVWGVGLLKHGNAASTPGRAPSLAKKYAWLFLVLPCPVCATVILFSAAFCISLFPACSAWTVVGLYATFVIISMTTVGLVHLYRKSASQPSEAFLGGAMVLMAAYFILAVTVMPPFADLDKVYRLACYHADTPAGDASAAILVAMLTAAAFALGCGITFKTIRRQS